MSAAENKAVFLSYASQDAEAVLRIAEALRASGVEVWFDKDELVGGDAWDAKIRGQIASCALFVPVISAATQARLEGYFRIEWKLAAQRTHAMAEEKAFLLPVVIDDTRDAEAKVPGEFRAVQWTRLPGGETPTPFAMRVARLLAGEAGRDRLVPPPSSEARSGPVRQPQRVRSRRWLAPTMLGGIVVFGALFWYQSRNRVGPAPGQPSGRISRASGVRSFIDQAWVKLNKPELARAELEVAEGFAKQATAVIPTDAEAWAVSSQVDSWFVLHGLDGTAERREAARSKAAKALQLAPTNYESRLAQACYLVRGGGDLVVPSDTRAADEVLQSLLKERPDEPRALFALATLQSNAGRAAEARSTYERLAVNPDFAVIAWNEIGWADYGAGHYADAEVAAGRSVTLQPYWGNLTLQTLLAVWWRGDLDAAKSIYDRIPAVVRQEDHGVANDCQLLFLRREPDALLRLLDGVPRDWLHSNAYDGPKAIWAALAQEQLGRAERARLQWQTALILVERRLADHPDADALLRLKASALAALGQGAEADKILQLARDSASAGSIQGFLRDVATQLRLGHTAAALDLLEHEPRLTAAACRIAPQFDVLGAQPRFQALRARLESDPQASPKATKAIVTSVGDQKSVAVLAFSNLSDDKANEYFSDGISEELLNVLAKVPGLKVTARTSSFHFKGKDTSIPEIARQLGVAYVVEGSVRKAGGQVRITAQLIKAADGFHVWSDNFDRELKDIFAVQDEIAGLIAKNLQIKLGTGDLIGSGTTNPEVLQLYLEGRQAWNLRSESGYARAEALLNRALELDPRFARAHAALADVWYVRHQKVRTGGGLAARNSPAIEKILAKINEALALDPNCAEAYASLGAVRGDNWEIEEAVRDLRRAIALNPNYATAHQWLANQLFSLGFVDEALAEDRRAAELDPLSHRILDNRSWGLTCAGRYGEAWATLERARILRPNGTQIACYRVTLLLQQGRKAEALAEARRLLTPELGADDPDFARYVAISVLVASGQQSEAAALLPQFPPMGDDRVLALVYLGRMNEALASLETATPGIIHYVLYGTPLREFDAVRNDPVLQAWLAKAGLTEAHARAQAWRRAHPPEQAAAR